MLAPNNVNEEMNSKLREIGGFLDGKSPQLVMQMLPIDKVSPNMVVDQVLSNIGMWW